MPGARVVLLPLVGATMMMVASCATPGGPCAGNISEAASEVRAARLAFNEAIQTRDIAAIEALLGEDVLLVTGTDSTVFTGRAEQVSIWQEDFEAEQRAVYTRTSECISDSPVVPVAHETGSWRGERTDDPESYAGGIYSAKWRKRDGAWQLEAEIFSTEDCGGTFCPEGAAQE